MYEIILLITTLLYKMLKIMKKLKFQLVFVLLLVPFFSIAQIDCSNFQNRKAEPPYEISSLTKSATCITGHTYEFVIPLSKGYEYRILFFASSVFNNKVNFKIVDLNTSETVLDIPGESNSRERGTCALAPYYNVKLNREIHPYFDFFPQSTTNLKIIIELEEVGNAVKNKGCIKVLVIDKKSDSGGF